ncbi:SpoIIE family protein phosphatase [Bacillus sp. NP157]|nr:SpoIIE family protein phosphatase [Bacillus sp. NP157]
MFFSTTRQNQSIALQTSGDTGRLVTAVESLRAGPVMHGAVAAARQLFGEGDSSGSVSLRPLHGGGIEMTALLTGAVPDAPLPILDGTSVITDRWTDSEGTCVLVRVLPESGSPDLPLGAVECALGGDVFSGDAWALVADNDAVTLFVVDGLGHGPVADIAARAALQAVATFTPSEPADDMRVLHSALGGTVGAVAGIARFDSAQMRVSFCGLGNISATVVHDGRRNGLASFPGVAGRGAPIFRTYRNVVGEGTHLVMHTDGLRPNWNPATYPGLFDRHPGVIAGVLFRDQYHGSDDALIAVLPLTANAHATLVRGSKG